MATPAPRSRSRASSSSGGSRRPARAPAAGSNSMPMILGVVGVVVVVVVLVMMNSGAGEKTAEASPKATTPEAPASASPKPASVQLAAAKAGKTPKRPAPALTQEMLGKLRSLTASASTLYNEGVTARTAGDHAKALEMQAKAKDTLDELQTLLADQLLWQEEAQMEDWAQPAEYITLEREYGKAMSLTKKIRMGGGK